MTKDETQREEHGDRVQIQGQVRERERARDMTDRRGHQVENKETRPREQELKLITLK